MKLFKLVSDEELAELSKWPNVLTEKTEIIPPPNETIDALMNFYKTKVEPFPSRDENAKILIKIMEEIEKEPDERYEANIMSENGYDISVLPRGTLLYKGLTWFYDSVYADNRIWLGNIKTAGIYLNSYFAGMLAYRTNKPTRMFILNPKNILKLSQEAPPAIQQLCREIFGVGITLKEKIMMKHRPPVWLRPEKECTDDAVISLYSVNNPSTFRITQHMLFEYVEKTFNCVGTVLSNLVSPLQGCVPQEITLKADTLDIDYNNKWSWMNWGLKDVNEVRMIEPTAKFINMNFNVVRWFADVIHNGLDTTHVDILSINVHYLDSVVKNISKEQMYLNLVTFIKQVDPIFLTIQELPREYVTRLQTDCNYVKSFWVPNGMNNSDMVLAVFTKKHCKPTLIRKRYDRNRGSIILETNHNKILFTHAPCGKNYIRGNRILYPNDFYEAYFYNTKLRSQFFHDILKYQPDMVIGDLNFLPINSELSIFENAGYKYNHDNTPTSIHDVKVDWVFYKPQLMGKQHIFNWYESDHRPIGFTFDKFNLNHPVVNKYGGSDDDGDGDGSRFIGNSNNDNGANREIDILSSSPIYRQAGGIYDALVILIILIIYAFLYVVAYGAKIMQLGNYNYEENIEVNRS